MDTRRQPVTQIPERPHDDLAALIPAYALGAADAEERVAVEAHLRTCVACRAALADYQALGDDLLYALPPAAAPARLADDLRKRIAPSTVRPAARRGWLARLRWPSFTLGLVALALLVATNAYWAGRTVRAERATAQLTALVQAPGIALHSATVEMHGSGVLYLPPGAAEALLCVYDLPALSVDQAYQVWLIRGGQRVSGGAFQVSPDGYGVLLLHAPAPLQDFDALGITVEPAAGSPAPTTPPVLSGQL